VSTAPGLAPNAAPRDRMAGEIVVVRLAMPLKREIFPIADIYVPVKRRATLKPALVQEIAASMLEVGQQTPIMVRQDGTRLVLVEGLHRLEACKALGETTIQGYLVQARKH
jgi:sulfiredoxin